MTCPWCSAEIAGRLVLDPARADDPTSVCWVCAMPVWLGDDGRYRRLKPGDLDVMTAEQLRGVLGAIMKVRTRPE